MDSNLRGLSTWEATQEEWAGLPERSTSATSRQRCYVCQATACYSARHRAAVHTRHCGAASEPPCTLPPPPPARRAGSVKSAATCAPEPTSVQFDPCGLAPTPRQRMQLVAAAATARAVGPAACRPSSRRPAPAASPSRHRLIAAAAASGGGPGSEQPADEATPSELVERLLADPKNAATIQRVTEAAEKVAALQAESERLAAAMAAAAADEAAGAEARERRGQQEAARLMAEAEAAAAEKLLQAAQLQAEAADAAKRKWAADINEVRRGSMPVAARRARRVCMQPARVWVQWRRRQRSSWLRCPATSTLSSTHSSASLMPAGCGAHPVCQGRHCCGPGRRGGGAAAGRFRWQRRAGGAAGGGRRWAGVGAVWRDVPLRCPPGRRQHAAQGAKAQAGSVPRGAALCLHVAWRCPHVPPSLAGWSPNR